MEALPALEFAFPMLIRELPDKFPQKQVPS